MEIVMRDGAAQARRAGSTRSRLDGPQGEDRRHLRAPERRAFHTSGRLRDDGLIDPRDTRRVLALCLAVCDEAKRAHSSRCTFGVARP